MAASEQHQRPRSGRGGGAAAAATAPRRRGDAAVGWTTLIVGIALSGLLYWKNHYTDMWFEEYYLFNTALLLWPPLCLILFGFRRELSEFGMTAGDIKGGSLAALVGFLLFLPVLYFVARTPDAQSYYLGVLLGNRPYGSGAISGLAMSNQGYVGGVIDWSRLAFHETVFAFYMFAWEWFFRGFLLNGLRRLFPAGAAVAIQAVLFCWLHWGKPMPEVYSSLAGGILLGAVALRYRSFLPCFLVHWGVSAANDLGVLWFHFHR